ncbi:MAG: aspartate kinase [Thermoanaerobaculia bacterium]|nr:aspartate kinase [Thermoanaerobaculia bacterium]
MIVCKFGGTSLASGREIAARAEVVESRRARGCLVVASAMARVSRELLRLARAAESGSRGEVDELLEGLLQRHREALSVSGISPEEAGIEAEGRKLETALEQVLENGTLSPGEIDRILATGELLSSRIVHAVLQSRDVPTDWIDPRDLVVTDESYGDARPDLPETARRVRDVIVPRLSPERVVVTGGFVGRSRTGNTTTLGWGASDLSASLLGAVLGAETVEIWTDVDGIATADPKLVPTARTLRRLSHREAAELAYFGAEVLHHRAITPLVGTSVILQIRNSFRPEDPGTLVVPRNGETGVRGVSLTSPFLRETLPSSLSCPSQEPTEDPVWGFQGQGSRYRSGSGPRGGARVSLLTLVGHGIHRNGSVGLEAGGILSGTGAAEGVSGPCDAHLAFVLPGVRAETALRRVHDAFCGEDRP